MSVPDSSERRRLFKEWLESLPKFPQTGHRPARGTIAAALVVLRRLENEFDLNIDSHLAKGGTQIKGTGGASLAKVLQDFGVSKSYLSEGGRTNRGVRAQIESMLSCLRAMQLERHCSEERRLVLQELGGILIEEVQAFFARKKLSVPYDPNHTVWQLVHELIKVARNRGQAGPLAQYLVGAKLQLRYPDLAIRNDSFSTSDEQLGKGGDFEIGDTVFHVTVSPMPAVYKKCLDNITNGRRAYLLVPGDVEQGTRQLAEATSSGQISVSSIESFVSQNLDELSEFQRDRLERQLGKLFACYNRRVDLVESDKTLMLQIPAQLTRLE